MTYQALQSILTADPVTAVESTGVLEVLATMERLCISCVVVVDPQQRPAGIFTEQDAVHLMATREALENMPLGRVMQRPVFTVAADLDYRDAYRQMNERGFRHLVVVDAQQRLAGVVSEGDFLHHLGIEYLVELKSVGSVMTPDPVDLPETAPLAQALTLMTSQHFSCVLITRNRQPVGMLTERDLVRLARQHLDLEHTPVSQVMKGPVLSISAASPLQEAIRQMDQAGIRRLAVMENGRLAGLVTRHDIVKSLQGRYIEYLHETIERQRRDMARAQDEMQTVSRQLRGYSLMEQVSEPILVVDVRQGQLVEVNTQACESLGYTRDELLALDMLSLSTLAAGTPVWQGLEATLRAQGRLLLETRLRRRDGSLLPVQLHARLAEADGQAYIVAVVRDLSLLREQDDQLQLQLHALNATGNAILLTDAHGSILWANAAFGTLSGYALAETIGRTPADLLRSGQQDRLFYQSMWSTILGGQVWRGELVNRRKDGSRYHEAMSITPVCIGGQAITHFIAVKQDISERRRVEAALHESEERFRQLFERSPVAYQSLDVQGRLLTVNEAWLALLGKSRSEVIGRAFSDFVAPDGAASCQERLVQFLDTGLLHAMECDLLHQDGSRLTVELEGCLGHDHGPHLRQAHCVLHNVTVRKAQVEARSRQAAIDPLTGLTSRQGLSDELALALGRYQRQGISTALLMLNLDDFKRVNDQYGHGAGDTVLRRVAQVMTASLRRSDVLGRPGDDQFTILLTDAKPEGALAFSERLCRRVAAQQMPTLSGDVTLTLSIGVTPFAPTDTSIESVLERAGRALCRAKGNGRNRVELEPAP